MNNKIPSTPSFYAVGHLTGGEVWLAPDLPTLIGDLIGDEEYLSRDKAGRLTARERVASQLATRSQAGLLQAAVRDETWSWECASLKEIDRLTRARQITDRDGHWGGSVPLVLVKPQDPQWKVPTGRVRIISAVSDSRLLWGAIELGWVAGGRLDSSYGIGDRGRL